MNNYVLSFDPLNPTINHNQLALLIRVSREIESWHSPFLGTYLLKSNEELLTLQKSFFEFFGSAFFVLATVDPRQTGGYLPSTIWKWFAAGVNSVWISLSQLASVPPPPPTR